MNYVPSSHKYNPHRDLVDVHALLSPSRSGWENKTDAEILVMVAKEYSREIGRCLHKFAENRIRHKKTLPKGAKKEVYNFLICEKNIPEFALEFGLEWNTVYQTLMLYVNDSIDFGHDTEQPLWYRRDIAGGTSDSVTPLENILRNKIVRIFDLKTGTSPVHMEQCYKYAALLCLEYDLDPYQLVFETRLYYNGEVIIDEPPPSTIAEMMNNYIHKTEVIEAVMGERTWR